MCNCIHELLNVFEDSAQREHTIVEDNHYIMHSYTMIYARTTVYASSKTPGQIALHGAYRLEISNACSYPKGLVTLQ